MILIWLTQANEWVASNRILVFSQRFLGSPQNKHCDCFEVQKTIMERDHRFFAAVLSELDWVMLIQGKREFCLNNLGIRGKIHRLTFHHAQGLSWNWHPVLVSKFKHISYKSPKNNSIKPFQFLLRVLSLLLASSFFLGLVIQKRASYLEAAGDWNGQLGHWILSRCIEVIKHLHCLFAVVNENETALIIGAKLNPFFSENA